MSITIPGVPESLTRAEYVALVEGAGFTATEVNALRFTPRGIYATLLVRNADGEQIPVDATSKKIKTAKHTVFVKVVD